MNIKYILQVFAAAMIVVIVSVAFLAMIGGLLFLSSYFLGEIAGVAVTFFIGIFVWLFFTLKEDYKNSREWQRGKSDGEESKSQL